MVIDPSLERAAGFEARHDGIEASSALLKPNSSAGAAAGGLFAATDGYGGKLSHSVQDERHHGAALLENKFQRR